MMRCYSGVGTMERCDCTKQIKCLCQRREKQRSSSLLPRWGAIAARERKEAGSPVDRAAGLSRWGLSRTERSSAVLASAGSRAGVS